MPSAELVFRGARVVDPAAGRDEVADVRVSDGVIAEVGTGLGRASAEVLDCHGLVLAPGLVDLHTHLRARLRPAATRPWPRWPTPIRWPTTRP